MREVHGRGLFCVPRSHNFQKVIKKKSQSFPQMNTKFSYFRIYICVGVRRTSTGQAKKGGRTVIEVKNLTKRYGDHTENVILQKEYKEGRFFRRNALLFYLCNP